MTKRMTKGIATLALMATVCAPIAAAAQENDLQGLRSGRGDSELQRRGYKLEKTSGDSQFWWNSRTDTCIRVKVWRGRYEDISSASKSDCGKGGGPSAGVVVGAAVAIGLIAALASKKDKGPDYKRGYEDGLNGNPYDRNGNDRYREGYQAGETEAQKRPDPQRDPEYKRGYDDGLYGRNYDRRGNDRYRDGYQAGQNDARRPDPQRDPDYKRGYDDGLYGRNYDRRGNDRYREGFQAGQNDARRPDPQRDPEYKRGYDDGIYGRNYDRRGNDRYREGYQAGQNDARNGPDDRGSLRNVPQVSRDACARRADEDLNARRGTSVPVSARELNRNEWEVVVETGRERSRCTVDSRGYVRSLTGY